MRSAIGVPVVRPSNTPERSSTVSDSRRCVPWRAVPGFRRSDLRWISPASSARPGGHPSTTQPMAGPCDSPKEVTQNSLPNVLPDMVESVSVPGKSGRRFHERSRSLSSDPDGSSSTRRHHSGFDVMQDKHQSRAAAQAARVLAGSRCVAMLTGAGISAESGVPTFRDAQTGLWAQFDPLQLATPSAVAIRPKLVWDWYGWRRELVARVQPNPAHHALVDIERRVPDCLLITQNVDGLHRRAGSRNVV